MTSRRGPVGRAIIPQKLSPALRLWIIAPWRPRRTVLQSWFFIRKITVQDVSPTNHFVYTFGDENKNGPPKELKHQLKHQQLKAWKKLLRGFPTKNLSQDLLRRLCSNIPRSAAGLESTPSHPQRGAADAGPSSGSPRCLEGRWHKALILTIYIDPLHFVFWCFLASNMFELHWSRLNTTSKLWSSIMFLYVFVAFSIHFLATSSPSFIIVHHFVLSFQLPNPIQPHPAPSNPHLSRENCGHIAGQYDECNASDPLPPHQPGVHPHRADDRPSRPGRCGDLLLPGLAPSRNLVLHRNQISRIFVRIFNKKKGCMMIIDDLVGGFSPPLWKYELVKVSWDYEIPNIWKHEKLSKAPTSDVLTCVN